ncbi:MAG TPA: hypothetical protein VLF59_02205 [Candidatus Saccharimonadales bacterium]|nr:hypothetical protein [Candidatus Saccharimonadales bacterium]
MQSERFSYTDFTIADDQQTVEFRYTLAHAGMEHHLTETLTFPAPLLDTPEQQRSLRALHLALGISYYKTFLSPIISHPYAMNEVEAAFWNSVWRGGLGEFLYVNKLKADILAQFVPQDGQTFDGQSPGSHTGAILGIGGGKDSIVAGELLKKLQLPIAGFVMATGEQLGQAGDVARTMEIPLHAVSRSLDKQLLDLQEQPGAYKGHIPISLIFGLVGTALAVAAGHAYVVVANEASASIPRIQWGDQAVNHQWSKSFAFEQSLQRYIHEHITSGVTYFSAIRSLSSIGVAKLFARLPQYFEVFTSDNFVFRIDPARRPSGRWSLESPKSLSSYILLAPWLTDAEVTRIFTIDFLDEPSLRQLFLELTGIEGEPPLDCVGTVEELVLSMNLLAQAGRYRGATLMGLARERGIIQENIDWDTRAAELLALSPDQALPEGMKEAITLHLQEQLAS